MMKRRLLSIGLCVVLLVLAACAGVGGGGEEVLRGRGEEGTGEAAGPLSTDTPFAPSATPSPSATVEPSETPEATEVVGTGTPVATGTEVVATETEVVATATGTPVATETEEAQLYINQDPDSLDGKWVFPGYKEFVAHFSEGVLTAVEYEGEKYATGRDTAVTVEELPDNLPQEVKDFLTALENAGIIEVLPDYLVEDYYGLGAAEVRVVDEEHAGPEVVDKDAWKEPYYSRRSDDEEIGTEIRTQLRGLTLTGWVLREVTLEETGEVFHELEAVFGFYDERGEYHSVRFTMKGIVQLYGGGQNLGLMGLDTLMQDGLLKVGDEVELILYSLPKSSTVTREDVEAYFESKFSGDDLRDRLIFSAGYGDKRLDERDIDQRLAQAEVEFSSDEIMLTMIMRKN